MAVKVKVEAGERGRVVEAREGEEAVPVVAVECVVATRATPLVNKRGTRRMPGCRNEISHNGRRTNAHTPGGAKAVVAWARVAAAAPTAAADREVAAMAAAVATADAVSAVGGVAAGCTANIRGRMRLPV